MIESYSFGQMVIGRQKYTSDLIIFPDRIHSSWWRISGHRLSLKDLKEVIKEEPEIIVIGTGAVGLMTVEEEVKKYAREKGIILIIEKTKTAVQKFNELTSTKKIIGAFHLTC
ncbi:MAG: Mth938-like domain-containing protein [Candidatus Aminicenantaceae bacterium]